MVAPRGEVFFTYEVGRVVVETVLREVVGAFLSGGVDVVVGGALGWEEGGVREEKGQVAKQLAPPGTLDDHDLAVHGAEAAISHSDVPAGPADAALPLPRAPDQDAGHDAAHQGDFFGHLDYPVDRATNAATIFAGMEEEGVEEVGDP